MDVAAELLLLQLPGADAVADHRPFELSHERKLVADEFRHRAVPVLLGYGDDADAVALQAALEDDQRGVVTGEPIKAGDEEDLAADGTRLARDRSRGGGAALRCR